MFQDLERLNLKEEVCMTFKNLPTVLLGLAIIASLGGCCTSGSGSAPCSSDQVYSAPSAPTPAAVSDCEYGCSAATESAMSYESSGTVVSSDEFYTPPRSSSETPYAIGETFSSSSNLTPIVSAPSVGEGSGFTARSATNTNSLPGNLLPGN